MNKGFVFVELLVAIGIFSLLATFTLLRVTQIQRRAPHAATVNTLVSDIAGQQTRAMSGDAVGGQNQDNYGIYFETNQYVLFKGSSFVSGDSFNRIVLLPTNITVTSISLPGSSLIFSKGSGEIVGYSESEHSIVVREGLTGEQKTIQFNRYGVISQIF